MPKCPNCGKSLWFVEDFCPFCKSALTEAGAAYLQSKTSPSINHPPTANPPSVPSPSPVPSTSEMSVTAQHKTCPYCGKQYPAEVTHCVVDRTELLSLPRFDGLTYYLKKPAEARCIKLTLDAIIAQYKAGMIDGTWSVRKVSDNEYSWITVKDLSLSHSSPTHGCPACGKRWPTNYCPECARTIEPDQAGAPAPPSRAHTPLFSGPPAVAVLSAIYLLWALVVTGMMLYAFNRWNDPSFFFAVIDITLKAIIALGIFKARNWARIICLCYVPFILISVATYYSLFDELDIFNSTKLAICAVSLYILTRPRVITFFRPPRQHEASPPSQAGAPIESLAPSPARQQTSAPSDVRS